MRGFNPGITDTRKITEALANRGYPDFAEYALVSLKRHLQKVFLAYDFTSADALINKINSDDAFTDILVNKLSVETTEMFRDPSMWRLLRDNIFPVMFSEDGKKSFWLPGSVSAEDLVSLIILLKESDLLMRSAITLTSLCEKSLDNIAEGLLKPVKVEVSEYNYRKFQGNTKLSEYLIKDDGKIFWDKNLLSGVTFSVEKSHLGASPGYMNCIIFRDKMIYLNLTLSNKVLERICSSLHPGGFLIIGSGESLTHTLFDKNFNQADQNEKVYRKNK